MLVLDSKSSTRAQYLGLDPPQLWQVLLEPEIQKTCFPECQETAAGSSLSLFLESVKLFHRFFFSPIQSNQNEI